MPEFFNLLFPISDFTVVGIFFILFLTYLFLNEDLLLSNVFELFTGVLILLPAESLVSRVSDVPVCRGNLFSGEFVSQKLIVRL